MGSQWHFWRPLHPIRWWADRFWLLWTSERRAETQEGACTGIISSSASTMPITVLLLMAKQNALSYLCDQDFSKSGEQPAHCKGAMCYFAPEKGPSHSPTRWSCIVDTAVVHAIV